jgi:hypothetical protein
MRTVVEAAAPKSSRDDRIVAPHESVAGPLHRPSGGPPPRRCYAIHTFLTREETETASASGAPFSLWEKVAARKRGRMRVFA